MGKAPIKVVKLSQASHVMLVLSHARGKECEIFT